MTTSELRALDAYDRNETLDLARDLARIPSFTTEETPVAQYLDRFLGQRGLRRRAAGGGAGPSPVHRPGAGHGGRPLPDAQRAHGHRPADGRVAPGPVGARGRGRPADRSWPRQHEGRRHGDDRGGAPPAAGGRAAPRRPRDRRRGGGAAGGRRDGAPARAGPADRCGDRRRALRGAERDDGPRRPLAGGYHDLRPRGAPQQSRTGPRCHRGHGGRDPGDLPGAALRWRVDEGPGHPAAQRRQPARRPRAGSRHCGRVLPGGHLYRDPRHPTRAGPVRRSR